MGAWKIAMKGLAQNHQKSGKLGTRYAGTKAVSKRLARFLERH